MPATDRPRLVVLHKAEAPRSLYRELTNSEMTWVDAVFWLSVGLVLGGVLVWSLP